MPERFLTLAQWFAPRVDVEEEEVPLLEPSAHDDASDVPEVTAALHEARYFRAALADALDAARADLVRDIACEVLARELELRDVDISAIVARACERYSSVPLAVRVHPHDAPSVRGHYPVIEDSSLRRGDVVIEVQSGTIDARLGARLESLLRI